MTIQYYNWLQCNIIHNFFENGLSTVFELVPFQETSRQMNNYSIRLNNDQGSFGFWIGKTESEPLNIESDFDGISNLYFQLIVRDPLFYNYTDLNIADQQKLLLFSNLNDLSGSNLMHRWDSASGSDAITARPSQFNYTLPQGNGILEISDESGNVVLENEFANEHPTTILIDLRNQDIGRYTLSLDNGTSDEFFLLHEPLQNECAGIVQINMQSLKANYIENMAYEIKFEPRPVNWQYKIILRPDHTLISLKIDGMESETYSGPVEEDFMGNQKAQVFMSSKPIPLKQKYDNSPLLRYAYSSEVTDSDTLELNLPIPGPEALKAKQNEEGEVSFYSTSIIYV